MSSSDSESSVNSVKARTRDRLLASLTDIGDSLRGRFRRSSSSNAASYSARILSKVTAKDIKRLERIGTGGFGEVFRLNHPRVGQLALKQLHLSRSQADAEDQRRRAVREGTIWQALEHPNVLPCYGLLEAFGCMFIVSPYMSNGALNQYIRAHRKFDRVEVIIQVAEATEYLHRNGIVHGDLKAANVLVGDNLQAQLCDFGLSKTASVDTSIGLEGQGSVRWKSVEMMLQGGGKTFQSDIWAFGMFIYEVLSGLLPFHSYPNDNAVMAAVLTRDERPPESPLFEADSCRSYRRLWEVAWRCWLRTPHQRGTMSEVNHELRSVTCRITGLPGVLDMQLSMDGSTLAVACTDSDNSSIRIYDVPSRQHTTIPGIGGGINDMAFFPNGRMLLTKHDTGVRVWDIQSGRESLNVGQVKHAEAVAFATNADVLACYITDGQIRVWTTAQPRRLAKLAKSAMDGRALAVSPDGQVVYFTGEHRTVDLPGGRSYCLYAWRWATNSSPKVAIRFSRAMVSPRVVIDPTCTMVAEDYGSFGEGHLFVWDLGSATKLWRLGARIVHNAGFSPDGKTLALIVPGPAGGDDTRWDAVFIDAKTGVTKARLGMEGSEIPSCQSFGQGRIAVGYESKDVVFLWDVEL